MSSDNCTQTSMAPVSSDACVTDASTFSDVKKILCLHEIEFMGLLCSITCFGILMMRASAETFYSY